MTKKDKDKDKGKKWKSPRAVSSPAPPIRVHDYQISMTKPPEKPKILMERKKLMSENGGNGGDKLKAAVQSFVDLVEATDIAILGPSQPVRDAYQGLKQALASESKDK